MDAKPCPSRVVAAKRLLRDANRAVARKTTTVAGIEGLLARTLDSLDIERIRLKELIDLESGAQRALTEAVQMKAKEDARSNAELVSETKSLAEYLELNPNQAVQMKPELQQLVDRVKVLVAACQKAESPQNAAEADIDLEASSASSERQSSSSESEAARPREKPARAQEEQPVPVQGTHTPPPPGAHTPPPQEAANTTRVHTSKSRSPRRVGNNPIVEPTAEPMEQEQQVHDQLPIAAQDLPNQAPTEAASTRRSTSRSPRRVQ